MATTKKSGKAKKARTQNKDGKGGRRKKKSIAANDPIIITGGSMFVEFNPDFDDDDANPSMGHKKVTKVAHPTSTKKIKAVEIYDDASNTLILRYILPASMGGKCRVHIKDA